MDKTEFEDALRKGHGRVIQHLQVADSAPFRGLILAACVEDWRYDRQCEPSRSEYLYEVVSAAGLAAECREALFHRLLTAEVDDLLPETMRLACEFARRGDEELHRAIYTGFDRCAVTGDFTGGHELVEMDGIDGFVHAASQFLRYRKDIRYWQFGSWINELEERDGKEEARVAIEAAGASDPQFQSLVDSERAEWNKRIGERDASRDASVLPWAEMLEAILNDRHTVGVSAWRWGRQTDSTQLALAADHLRSEADPNKLYKVLAIFTKTPFPFAPDVLLALLESQESKLAWRAASALSLLPHPRIRQKALEMARDPERAGMAGRLIRGNWEPGDGDLLVRMLETAQTPHHVDSVGLSVITLAETHSVPEMVAPLLIMYERTPCSFCRGSVVRHLLLMDALPADIAEECRFDSNLDIRKMVTEGLDADDT